MTAHVVCLVAAISIGLTACSIHPLPQDVTHDTTLSIAQKIRCETHRAVSAVLASQLSLSTKPETRALAVDLASGKRETASITSKEIDSLTLDFWEKYRATAVGYEFEFLISENNRNSGTAAFQLPFTNGTFTVGIAGGKELSRQNKRKFKVIETIEELAFSQPCSEAPETSKEFIYPITGSVGMDEVIDTFYRLSRQGVVLTTFSDQLTFTTKIIGGITPRVILSPIADKFRLAGASAELSSDRVDTHQLFFTLALPSKFDPRSVQANNAKQKVSRELNQLRTLDNQERILDALDARLVQ